MVHSRTIAPLVLWALVLIPTACSCVTGTDRHDDADQAASQPMSQPPSSTTNQSEPKPAGGIPARVQPTWQEYLANLLRGQREGTVGLGLFSYGGWADAGQYFVILPPGQEPAKFIYVEPSGKKVTFERVLVTVERDSVVEAMTKATSLSDYSPTGEVFDGLEYDYVAKTIEAGGNLREAKRIHIQNPGVVTKKGEKNAAEEHLKLIGVFEALKARPQSNKK